MGEAVADGQRHQLKGRGLSQQRAPGNQGGGQLPPVRQLGGGRLKGGGGGAAPQAARAAELEGLLEDPVGDRGDILAARWVQGGVRE